MAYVDLSILAQRESEQTEWKESVADIDDVVATLVAFANDLQNLGGGYVVCGAREAKDESGFPRFVAVGLAADRLKEIEHTVLARCRDRVSPPLTPLVEEFPAVEGASEGNATPRRVLVFIQAATSETHTFRRGKEGGKHFVRVGRSTIEARNGVLRTLLVRKGTLAPWDRRPSPSATIDDIDKVALNESLQLLGVDNSLRPLDEYLNSEDVALSPFMPSLCAKEGLTGTMRPRHSTLLLFGRNPQKFIPGAIAFFSTYAGLDKTEERSSRRELAGNLVSQLRRLRELLQDAAPTVFNKTDTVSPNIRKYPERAIFEAVGNVLAHRDYELEDPSRITVFSDRIEFLSPGGLPLGVTTTAFATGTASPRWRNQSLAWILNRLQFVQAEGQGISTILKVTREGGYPPPSFLVDETKVVCTIHAHRAAL